MESNHASNDSPHSRQHSDTPEISPSGNIGIYTVLSTLCLMRHQLGLEAMLDYIERYLAIIEKHSPQIKPAVRHILKRVNVEKIYHDAMRKEDE